MEIRSFLITILVIAFALLHYGEATKCYMCDSRISKTCANEPSPKEVVECPVNTNCGICNYKLSNGTEIFVRSCSFNILPEAITIDSTSCLMCDKDYCNNANMATVSMTALGCLVSFWAIRFVLSNSY
ncbi:Protein quiver [Camponotus japonicus]